MWVGKLRTGTVIMVPMRGNVCTNDFEGDGVEWKEATLVKRPKQNTINARRMHGAGAWTIITNRGDWHVTADEHVDVLEFRDLAEETRLSDVEKKLDTLRGGLQLPGFDDVPQNPKDYMS